MLLAPAAAALQPKKRYAIRFELGGKKYKASWEGSAPPDDETVRKVVGAYASSERGARTAATAADDPWAGAPPGAREQFEQMDQFLKTEGERENAAETEALKARQASPYYQGERNAPKGPGGLSASGHPAGWSAPGTGVYRQRTAHETKAELNQAQAQIFDSMTNEARAAAHNLPGPLARPAEWMAGHVAGLAAGILNEPIDILAEAGTLASPEFSSREKAGAAANLGIKAALPAAAGFVGRRVVAPVVKRVVGPVAKKVAQVASDFLAEKAPSLSRQARGVSTVTAEAENAAAAKVAARAGVSGEVPEVPGELSPLRAAEGHGGELVTGAEADGNVGGPSVPVPQKPAVPGEPVRMRMEDLEGYAEQYGVTLPEREKLVQTAAAVKDRALKNFDEINESLPKGKIDWSDNLSDEQRVVGRIRLEQLADEIDGAAKRMEGISDEGQKQAVKDELQSLLKQQEAISGSLYRTNSQLGRSLAFTKSLVEGPFDEASILTKAEAISGGELSGKQRMRISRIARRGRQAQLTFEQKYQNEAEKALERLRKMGGPKGITIEEIAGCI